MLLVCNLMIGCSITVLVLDVIAMLRIGARCLRQN